MQGTYDGNADQSFLDNTDIRYAELYKCRRQKIIYGVTINNNPTVQDVWNSTTCLGDSLRQRQVLRRPLPQPQ